MSNNHVIAKNSLRKLNFHKLKNTDSIIYVEAYQTPSSRFANAIFANFLANETSSNLIAFYQMRSGFFIWLKEQIRFLFSLEKVFGCKSFRIVGHRIKNESYILAARNILFKTESKEAFLDLKYRNILIGDLLYDGYLRWKNRITLDLNDDSLVDEISKTLQYVDNWLRILSAGKCKGILVSHTSYNLGIPARVGAYFGVSVYKADLNQIYKISSSDPFPLHRFRSYPATFNSFSTEKKQMCLAKAKESISRKFSGERGVDIFYGNYSAYSNENTNVGLSQNLLQSIDTKTTVLVALHDFVDSPHVYGNMLFADFYEWIKFLDELSKSLDFLWLIKPHPNSTMEQFAYLNDLCENNPHFKLIERGINNFQLANSNIDLCLTMYGTIGYEFAYLGIKVLTGCSNTPYGAYNFTQSATTLSEYRFLISQVDRKFGTKSTTISQDEILEYYYMHYIYNVNSWIIKDFTRYYAENAFDDLYNWNIFSYYFESDNIFDFKEITKFLNNFLISSDNSIKVHHLQ